MPSKKKSRLKTTSVEECPIIFGRKCEGKVCCQSTTTSGKQCKRPAVYQVDLTKGIKITGIQVCPPTACCFFCTQHLKLTAATGTAHLIHRAVKAWATKGLDYDQYYSLFPEENPLFKKN